VIVNKGQIVGERPHDRIVFQQVAKRVMVKQIIDSHDLDVIPLFENTKYRAPDSSKSIDSDSHDAASS
jgi:hypothetical protein